MTWPGRRAKSASVKTAATVSWDGRLRITRRQRATTSVTLPATVPPQLASAARRSALRSQPTTATPAPRSRWAIAEPNRPTPTRPTASLALKDHLPPADRQRHLGPADILDLLRVEDVAVEDGEVGEHAGRELALLIFPVLGVGAAGRVRGESLGPRDSLLWDPLYLDVTT